MTTWKEYVNEPSGWLHDFVSEAGGQKAAAIKLGVSPQFVGQMFHGKRAVPASILKKLKARRNGK